MAADILEKILAVKREEVVAAKTKRTLTSVRNEAENSQPTRGFVAAMRQKVGSGGTAPALRMGITRLVIPAAVPWATARQGRTGCGRASWLPSAA